MYIEAGLAIIAITLITLVIVLIRLSSQIERSLRLLQADVHHLSVEAIHLLTTMNAFVRADLHVVSEEASQLLNKLNDLSSDINNKSHSLNFLFKPFHFLNSKLSADSSEEESTPQKTSIPQILKWVVSSLVLIKTTKEFFKNEKHK